MNSSIAERLRSLEAVSRALDPGAAERAALARAAVSHAESFLEWFETSPGYRSDPGFAAGLGGAPIASEPAGFGRALELLALHVDHDGQNPSGGNFFAYIPLGNLYHAALADFLAAVTNRYSGSSFASPAAVHIENQVLAWLASVIGYPATSAGNLASGGSLANFSALVTARVAAGLKARDYERAVVYVTAQTHHCIHKGLRVAGMAESVVRRVPMDARYRMRPAALDAAMAADARAGLIPWLVVATAGTTDTGSVDPLGAVADVAAARHAWCHVDGSYGGLFALCAAGREVLGGIERSNSVALDPHKNLALPLGIGAVLVKDAGAMRAAFSFEANYISKEQLRQRELSPMELSPELSRPFRALRLWLPLQALGTRPFEAAMEEKLLLARHAHERLAAMDGVEVGPPPDLSIVIFRALPRGSATDPGAGANAEADAEANVLNARLETLILEDGRAALSGTTIEGRRYLRFAILSPKSHLAEVDSALDVIGSLMDRL